MADVTPLEPCPFCDGHTELLKDRAVSGGLIALHHGKGQCPLNGAYVHPTAWNTRTTSLTKERDDLSERVAVLEEALEPFAKAFLDQREWYIRRYPNHPMIGATNFDAMPDEWGMEKMRFSMGEFRRAVEAISAALTKDNNHE